MGVNSTTNNFYSADIRRSRLTVIKEQTVSQFGTIKNFKPTYPKDCLGFDETYQLDATIMIYYHK